jgi:Gluconolactonase
MSVPSTSLTAELFLKAEHMLGEGPFWFDDRLWWVDINDGCLCSVEESGKNPTCDSLGEKLTCAAPIGRDRFVVTLHSRIAVYDRRTKAVQTLTPPVSTASNVRFNDGKCDSRGRLVAGTLSGSKEPSNALYSYEAGQAIRTLRDGVILSNGLVWDPSGTTFYHVDSLKREVGIFRYDPDTGLLGERTGTLAIPAELGIPDGMTLDADGHLWIALWGGSAVGCWSPRTGKLLRKISLPCTQATSCCFGGKDLRRLFITTAREGLPASELEAQPLAGSIFVCDLETPGYPVNLFKENPADSPN